MPIEIFSFITLLIATLYFMIGIFIHKGLSKKYQRTPHKPKVTILVAARNEERHLPACLDGLGQQTYPSELLQTIVINDQSTDRTRQIIINHKEQIPCLVLVDIIDEKDGLKGKMNALAQGMEQAEGEIILISDADCRLPKTWVSEMVSYFTEEVGLVGSLTVIDRPGKEFQFFDRIQTLDWFFLQAVASGTVGNRLPVSVLGNNFGFLKSAYDKIGGFRSIGFSLTEDMALLNTILKRTEYRIAYPLHKGSMIQSLPLNNFREFIQQRKRWLSGGLRATIWGWILMSTSFLAHLMVLINLCLLNLTTPFFIAFVLLTGIDLSLVWRLIVISGGKKLVRYFMAFELFYYFYTLILSVAIFWPGKIYWKERSFNNK